MLGELRSTHVAGRRNSSADLIPDPEQRARAVTGLLADGLIMVTSDG